MVSQIQELYAGLARTLAALLPGAGEWRAKWRGVALAVFGLIVFYGLSVPANQNEAIDGYGYALAAETGPLTTIHDTRSILFHMINRLLYLGAESLGLGLSAFQVITGLSIVAGALAAPLFARLLTNGFGLSRAAAWTAAAVLALSYGMWRYAVAVEVYVPAILLMLITLNLMFDAYRRRAAWPAYLSAGALGGIAVLYYQATVMALFLAMPVLLLSRRDWQGFLAYGSAGVAVVLTGFLGAYALQEGSFPTAAELIAFAGNRGGEFVARPFSLATPVRILLAFSHSVVSLNWIFGVEPIVGVLDSVFPRQVASNGHKIFAAQAFAPWVWAPLLFLPLLAAALGWLGLAGLRAGRVSAPGRPVLFLLAAAAIHILITGRLDPDGLEVWILLLPALYGLAALTLIEPLARMGRLAPALTVVVLLGLTNLFAGVGIVQTAESDHYRARLAWLTAHGRAEDLLLINAGPQWGFLNYARYEAGVAVLQTAPSSALLAPPDAVRARGGDLGALLTAASAGPGRVFATEAFFGLPETPDIRRFRTPAERADHAAGQALAARLRPHARPVADSPAGTIYQIDKTVLGSAASALPPWPAGMTMPAGPSHQPAQAP